MTLMDARPEPGWPGLGIPEAAARLEHLGFLVMNGSNPAEPPGANLIVALRDRPTLTHFDPESVTYWVTKGGRGRPADLTRTTHLPLEQPFAWGPIKTTDRLDVFNSFLSFGGTLRANAVGPDETVAVFSSPAPIVRWTGHSQDVDPLADEIGAFFARIRVPIDFVPEAEDRLAALGPLALYAAMLDRIVRRYAASEALRQAHRAVAAWSTREAYRLRESASAAWVAGQQVAAEYGLDRA